MRCVWLCAALLGACTGAPEDDGCLDEPADLADGVYTPAEQYDTGPRVTSVEISGDLLTVTYDDSTTRLYARD